MSDVDVRIGMQVTGDASGAQKVDDAVRKVGDTALNGNGVRERVRLMESSGKCWILWTQTLANCPGDFPAEYLNVGLLADSSTPTGLIRGDVGSGNRASGKVER